MGDEIFWGKHFVKYYNNSQIKITLDNLQFGTYNVTVISSGDDKFDSETKSVLFEALKYDSPITIIYNEGNDLIAGNDLKIDISLNTNVKGYLFLTIEGKQYSEYMYSGHATFRLTKMTGGKHKYTVNFTGNDQYNPIFVSETIDVNYKQLDIDFNLNDEEEYGKAIILKPTVPSDYNNYLTVYIDDNRINSIAPGKSIYLVPSDGLDVGEHTITIKYNGNDFYLNGECSSKINITKANMTFKVSTTTDLEIMQTILKVTLGTLPASGNLTLNIDNKSYTSSNFNYGYSNFILYNLTAGQHSYTISYSGDTNINPKNESSQINIPFKESKINITVNNISVGEVLNIGMNVIGNPLTNISLYLNETFLMNVTSDEQINLTNLNEGTYVLTAIYNRDHVYDHSNDTKTFTVSKINPIMTVEVNNSTYGFPAKVIVGIDAEGNVTVKIGSLIFNDVKIENNSVVLDVSDIDVGTYIVEVTYNGNYKYNIKCLNATLTIKKASTNIFGTVNNISFSQNTIINIKSSIDGIAVIKINETTMQNVSVVANMVVPVTFENITAGKHNVTITLKPTNNNYNESTYNTEFTVSKKETSVNINVTDSIYGEEVIVNVTASEDGKVILTVGDITRERNVLANTETKFNFGVLAADSYEVEVSFDAGENFKPANDHDNIIVSPAKAEILSVQSQNNIYGENTIIKVKTNVDGVLTFKFGTAIKTFDVVANKLTSFDLGVYDVDIHSVEISLNAGNNYTKPVNYTSVTISPKPTNVNVNVKDSIYGKNVIVNVSASETGKITIRLGDIVKTVDVEANKITSIDLGIINASSYNINITFDGGKNYEISYNEDSFVVSPARSEIIDIQTQEYVYGENIIVKAKTNVDGILTVTVDEESKSVNMIANQLESIDMGIMNVKGYEVKLSFNAGSNYISAQNNTSLVVKPKNTSISLAVKTYYPDENVIINVTASETGKATVKINGINKTIDVVTNTVTSINFGVLNGDSYTVTANFTAGNNYINSTDSKNFKVFAKINEKDISIPQLPSSASGSVTVKLPSDASGTITLSINGKDYKFDVVNGVANVKMPELVNGAYTYSITYSGDSKYSSFTKTSKVTVNKPAPATKTTLTLKKVKVKRSAKKLTIQATLKINGKGVKNKVIKFKFNKKTYKARTNSKGVAKITVKKSVLKKLKKGKKVTYTASYGKITKKVTVKVK